MHCQANSTACKRICCVSVCGGEGRGEMGVDCGLTRLAQLSTENPSASSREYWMIYRGPGFLAVVLFGSSPFRRLSFSVFLCFAGRAYWRAGRGVWQRSQILPWRESLVLYKKFHTLWLPPYFQSTPQDTSSADLPQLNLSKYLFSWRYTVSKFSFF